MVILRSTSVKKTVSLLLSFALIALSPGLEFHQAWAQAGRSFGRDSGKISRPLSLQPLVVASPALNSGFSGFDRFVLSFQEALRKADPGRKVVTRETPASKALRRGSMENLSRAASGDFGDLKADSPDEQSVSGGAVRFENLLGRKSPDLPVRAEVLDFKIEKAAKALSHPRLQPHEKALIQDYAEKVVRGEKASFNPDHKIALIRSLAKAQILKAPKKLGHLLYSANSVPVRFGKVRTADSNASYRPILRRVTFNLEFSGVRELLWVESFVHELVHDYRWHNPAGEGLGDEVEAFQAENRVWSGLKRALARAGLEDLLRYPESPQEEVFIKSSQMIAEWIEKGGDALRKNLSRLEAYKTLPSAEASQPQAASGRVGLPSLNLPLQVRFTGRFLRSIHRFAGTPDDRFYWKEEYYRRLYGDILALGTGKPSNAARAWLKDPENDAGFMKFKWKTPPLRIFFKLVEDSHSGTRTLYLLDFAHKDWLTRDGNEGQKEEYKNLADYVRNGLARDLLPEKRNEELLSRLSPGQERFRAWSVLEGRDFPEEKPRAVWALIAVNSALFLLTGVLGFSGWIYDFGLTPAKALSGEIWRLGTYLFLHNGALHLLFNMAALWIFGKPLERDLGAGRFLKFYFFTGIAAGLFNAVLTPGSEAPIIGASGAIYAVFVAYAMRYPDSVLYLYFAIPLPIRKAVVILAGFELWRLAAGSQGVAPLTHLGGMLAGYLYLKLSRSFPSLFI